MELESAALTNGHDGGPSAKLEPPHLSRRRRRCTCRNLCLAATLVTISLVILIVILAFTVFKPRKPITAIDSLAVKGLNFSVDVLRLQVNINLTMAAGVSVKNPNKFKAWYDNSTAVLNYRGEMVGGVPIPAGKISAGETKPMNMTLTLLAGKLLSEPKAMSDVLSGSLPLNTYIKMSGKVKIIVFKIHFHAITSCNFTVFLSNSSVSNQVCAYKTKL